MSMPQIPQEIYRPCLKETVIDLMESIALEEIALSHLVNAESEKIQAFICAIKNSHSCNKGEEFIKFNNSVGKIIDTVIMKEWILLKKLEDVMQIDYKEHHKEDDCECHNECKKHHKHDCCKKKDDCDDECECCCYEKCCGCNNSVKIKIRCHCNDLNCDD